MTTGLSEAIALQKDGKLAQAEALYREILARTPGHFEALHLLGVVQYQQGRYEAAAELIRDAIGRNPGHPAAHSNLGAALEKLGRFDQALASFDHALLLRPGHAETLRQRGHALQALDRHEDALASFDRAILAKPDYPEALQDRGDSLQDLKRHDEALASYDGALQLKPDNAQALNNRGAVLEALMRHDDALASYDRALALKPDYVRALYNRGAVLAELQRYGDAVDTFSQLVALDPDYDYALGNLLKCRLHCCDWENLPRLVQRVASAVDDGRKAIVPFSWLAISSSEAANLRCARTFAANRYPASATAMWRDQRYRHDSIRVAYLSADFHDNATAYLMAGLFESHDPRRFETTAISFGPDTGGPMRARLERAFGRFVDVRALRDREVARMLRDWEIDIAVDLKGFTMHARTGIFAHRPAPIQVSYLGFPGTLGAPYMDYIVADGEVIPAGQEGFYTEEVVRLPESYQVNDRRRRIAERTPGRGEVGLPETGFVFCCFNNNYKITPEVFAVWMRLLKAVAGSVLWLLEDNAAASRNLRAEAARRGVGEERLVFAPRMQLEAHLARHRLADLFVDTLPYNAHTTASDALWAGLPVLTCMGSAFAGRVGGSLLKAAGLPELITQTLGEYEALALRLATEPARLAEIRARLARQRDRCALFDTDRFRRHLEAAYVQMWERWQRGEPNASFTVTPLP